MPIILQLFIDRIFLKNQIIEIMSNLTSVQRPNQDLNWNLMLKGEYLLPNSCSFHRSTHSTSLLPYYSQQKNINKWELNMQRYRKYALSKRRQHSSYKAKNAEYSKVYEEENWSALSINSPIKVSKIPRLKHSDDVTSFNKILNENVSDEVQYNLEIETKRKSNTSELKTNDFSSKTDRKESISNQDSNNEMKQENNVESEKNPSQEKPWIVYLRTLRIPIIWPIHRKLFLMISDNFRVPDVPEVPNRRQKNNSIKRTMNRNPNCNHNNSQFHNSQLMNIRFDKEHASEDKNQWQDLIWKNSELYNQTDEINALATVLCKLFTNPRLGENLSDKKRHKLKTIAGKLPFWCCIEIEEYYESLDIIIDGKLINKNALWTLKKLNPHHKTFLYALIKLNRVGSRYFLETSSWFINIES